MVFDLDLEKVDCLYYSSLEDNFAKKTLRAFALLNSRVRRNAAKIYRKLKKEFKEIIIVFSGRGRVFLVTARNGESFF